MVHEMALKHAELLKEVDASFEVNKIMFSDKGISFEGDPSSYWLIKRGGDQILISHEGVISGFRVATVKSGVRKEFEIPVFPKKAVDKFRLQDLTYLIAECFDFNAYKPEGNLTEVQQEKFFELAERYLNYQGLNPVQVLEDNHPRQLDAEIAADALSESVKRVLLLLRERPGVEESLKLLLDEYENLSELEKLGYILDRAEKLADRFSIQ
ncbi:hypothetical protein [Sporosarcina sp. FSL K6-1508]|uniref:hypothetical protein n=1 Tax=Sporosarcina sp. FSL K6-1508 TaxID=2921553 RepID=UPI0030FD0C7C